MNAPAFICRPSRRRRSGMVLFEVLMALFVFTMVGFGLVLALNNTFETSFDREQIDTAVRGLNNQLALLHASRVLVGERDVPDDGTGFQYHVSVAQEVLKDQKNIPLQNMYSATITVTWQAHGETQTRSVSELLYQP
jgi:Tfp pilus assembly protein PilV